jgi:hypothetical protein
MATVASLFGDQLEATKALDALVDSPFAEVPVRVYEPELDADVERETAANFVDTAFSDPEFDDLGTEEREFFARGFRSGGTLVVAAVDDDQAAALRQFLADFGGRTSLED